MNKMWSTNLQIKCITDYRDAKINVVAVNLERQCNHVTTQMLSTTKCINSGTIFSSRQ